MRRFDPFTHPLAGQSLVEASAGTGKTYALSTLFVRLLVEAGFGIDQILAVTFTEAAASDLLARLNLRLKEMLDALDSGVADDPVALRYLNGAAPGREQAAIRLRQALLGFDGAAVFTIHGFCRRVLEENAFESRALFDAELIKDQSVILSEIVHDFWAREVAGASPAFIRYLRSANVWPDTLLYLVDTALAGLDTAIVPEHGEGDDADGEFERAFDAARSIWRRSRDEISELLLVQDTLHAGKYPRARMGAWFENLDEYFQSVDGAYPLRPEKRENRPAGEALIKLAASRIESATKKNREPLRHAFFDACERLGQASQLFVRRLAAFKRELVLYARQELGNRKRASAVWSFDDLLLMVDETLGGPAGQRLKEALRGKFKAALIDEFQDTDRIQYRIFKRLFSAPEQGLVLIGDPKQSIYAFRGADVFAYLFAARDAGESVFTLDVNWRSGPALVEAVNALFGCSPNPFVIDGISHSPVSCAEGSADALASADGSPMEPLRFRFIERMPERVGKTGALIKKRWTDAHLPGMVADDIAGLLESGATIGDRRLDAADIAVLTRTNRQAGAVAQALDQYGLKSVLWGSESVFKSQEAAELAALLDAMAHPDQGSKVRAALATGLVGLTGNEILGLLEDDLSWQGWTLAFYRWRDEWSRHGLMRTIRSFLAFSPEPGGWPLSSRILGSADGERRMTNLGHLIELAMSASEERRLGPDGTIRWLYSMMGSASPPEEARLRCQSDDPAVTVITVHKAKGLEFNVVYCPYLWDGSISSSESAPVVFHDPKNLHRRTLDLGSDELAEHVESAMMEELAESLRLAYVALTRARHLSLVACGGISGMETSPLGYLVQRRGEIRSVEDLKSKVRSLSDDQLLADLKALEAKAGPGAIDVSGLAAPVGARTKRPVPAVPALRAREQARRIPEAAAVTSFSSLTSGGLASVPLAEDADLSDELYSSAETSAAAGNEASGVSGDESVALADFEKGPRAGSCLHGIFEELDFTVDDSRAQRALIASKLAEFGFSAETWTDRVIRAVADIMATPLDADGTGFSLRRIARHGKLTELEFIFPVLDPRSGDRREVSLDKLASVLKRRSSKSTVRNWAGDLARLGGRVPPGFLKGFIDLVFEREGRYFLADYKSNHLGVRAQDYSERALERAMAEHHYFLQYHLYTVALHRYLEFRLEGYDYDTHFGGVYYLFLRGMAPSSGPGFGVFRARPEKELVAELSGLFRGGRS